MPLDDRAVIVFLDIDVRRATCILIIIRRGELRIAAGETDEQRPEGHHAGGMSCGAAE